MQTSISIAAIAAATLLTGALGGYLAADSDTSLTQKAASFNLNPISAAQGLDVAIGGKNSKGDFVQVCFLEDFLEDEYWGKEGLDMENESWTTICDFSEREGFSPISSTTGEQMMFVPNNLASEFVAIRSFLIHASGSEEAYSNLLEKIGSAEFCGSFVW